MRERIVSLDVGTTVAKAVVFDRQGREMGLAEYSYGISTPEPGHVELDPEQVFTACCRAMADVAGPDVVAICLTTQGGSLIPADENGRALSPMVTWMDRRAEGLVNSWFEDGTAGWMRGICGWAPQPGLPLPVICWFRVHQPGQFARTKRWLGVNDWLTGRLTGRFATNPSLAAEMMLMDIGAQTWSAQMCDFAGISPETLSPVLPSDAVVGTLFSDLARSLGLAEDVVLVNGGQDHCCEALAVGMTDEGTGLLACGTAWVINGAMGSARMDDVPPRMDLNVHVVPERWIASQYLGGLGGAIEWWASRFCEGLFEREPDHRDAVYTKMGKALDESPVGARGITFLPLEGSMNCSDPVRGQFRGLDWSHGFEDMTRALFESAVMEVRWAIDEWAHAGHPLRELWMIGGATRSPALPGMIADSTGIPVVMTGYSHGPALGAAMLGAVCLGFYDNLDDVRRGFAVKRTVRRPESSRKSAYDELYNRYRREAKRGGRKDDE